MEGGARDYETTQLSKSSLRQIFRQLLYYGVSSSSVMRREIETKFIHQFLKQNLHAKFFRFGSGLTRFEPYGYMASNMAETVPMLISGRQREGKQ